MSSAVFNPIITIDGPSGAGKGTVAYRLAQALGLNLLDSGALYRIVGLLAHEAGLLDGQVADLEEKLGALTEKLDLAFRVNDDTKTVEIVIDGQVLTKDIRNETVGGYASQVAVFPKVRAALLKVQQDMGKKGVVADGRDMGTVIFPNATAKIFLTASAKARADRRVAQLQMMGKPADYEAILAEIQARDERDQNRAAAPSKPAEDALVIDSSALNADEVYAKVVEFCAQKGVQF
ncbi:cytidylate kinase [Moraxella caviae]|uniref:Cytidylate kinase n=1 Tax=Moraxella caviae TaxID=34060 RepID=A0A1S9ZUS4_9GAMM|nr:(d)CMP kinase [Moraxella caviae]OOR87248.1 cytidylate kinase [Moraxella caviae]STZ14816.1 Cytidylate kinase [Moraxella caviae]VEW11291.1 Cytidylate kinase [Moraxella caviae]